MYDRVVVLDGWMNGRRRPDRGSPTHLLRWHRHRGDTHFRSRSWPQGPYAPCAHPGHDEVVRITSAWDLPKSSSIETRRLKRWFRNKGFPFSIRKNTANLSPDSVRGDRKLTGKLDIVWKIINQKKGFDRSNQWIYQFYPLQGGFHWYVQIFAFLFQISQFLL